VYVPLVDEDLLAGIASRLDLRDPNRRAIETLAAELVQYFEMEGRPAPFEGVIDSATGVGKTYILAGAIEYLAALGVRNFAVIAPGRTILEKTVANFRRGDRKSLLGGMEVDPFVITSENFATGDARRALDDQSHVKLFIFTVQALTRPTSDTARKTDGGSGLASQASWAPATPSSTTKDARVLIGAPGRVTKSTMRKSERHCPRSSVQRT